jgi:hypothetical protein
MVHDSEKMGVLLDIGVPVLRALLRSVLEGFMTQQGLNLNRFHFRLGSNTGRIPFTIDMKVMYPLLFGMTAAYIELTVKGAVIACSGKSLRLDAAVSGPGVVW